MSDTKYTTSHEWVRMEGGDVVTIGITDHAQTALGDVVFVDLPEVGREVGGNEACAVVESVKAASDVYAPVSGEVIEGNQRLVDDPALVNSAAESDGWFFKLRLSDPSQLEGLMDESAYKAFADSQ